MEACEKRGALRFRLCFRGNSLVPLLVMDGRRDWGQGNRLKGDEDLCHVVWLGRKAGCGGNKGQ